MAYQRSLPTPNEDSLNYLQDQLLDIEEIMEPLLTEKVPDLPLATIAEVQQLLPSSETIFVDYFLGYDHLFVFTITQKHYFLHQIPYPTQLLRQVAELKTEISTNHFEYEPRKAFQQYIQAASQLYHELIEVAVLNQLDFIPKHLILSPDDQLWTIPFEVLLKGAPESEVPNYHPEALSYLFEECSISYVNSATLFVFTGGQTKATATGQKLAAFAPEFEQFDRSNNRDGCSLQGLAKLNYNQLEAQKITQTFTGTTFLGHSATKKQFAAAAQKFEVLHLATHACITDEAPLDNRIFFADGELSVYEIYQMNFNSQLVVLSACETGVGSIHQGEGVLSLARGFVQANCPNVVMSLWEVADQATAHLMDNFYQQLEAGHSQSTALQQAKLEFLRQQDRTFTHPYYWAGFVHLGRDETISTGSSWWSGWWILPVWPRFL